MMIDETTTDADLLASWTASRDSEALAIVAHRYAPMVLGVCRRHCRTPADADDAFQVTFLILARSAASIRSPSALPGWLHSTAYRVALRTRRRPPVSDAVVIDEVPDPREPLDQIARSHELQLLDEELARMPEPLRAALVMHYLEGLRISQVADRLEITLGTIRGRLQRGRRELRQRLILRGVSLGGALAVLQMLPDRAAAAASLADAFLHSAPGHIGTSPTAEPQTFGDLQTLLSSSTSSSASLIMKTSLVVAASALAVLLLPWGQGEAQPPAASATDQPVLSLAGSPAAAAGAPFTAPPSEKPKALETAGEPPASEDPFSGAAERSNAEPSGGSSENSSEDPFAGDPRNSGSDPFGRSSASSGNDPFGGSSADSGNDPFGDRSRPAAARPASGVPAAGVPAAARSATGMPAAGRAPGGNGSAAAPQADTSPSATALDQKLQRSQELPTGTVPMKELVSQLSKTLEAPVFLEPHTELTGIDGETSITLETSGMPLELELKQALRPHALRAISHDGALLITADTTQLARRGIGTSRYINVDDSYMQELEEKLAQPFSQNFNQIPLEDAMRIISDESKIEFVIDTRALEDLGLTSDLPVRTNLSDVSLHGYLQHMLREADLTLHPRDGFVLITTVEEAEDPNNQISRAYWLDGTGLNPDSIMKIIQTTIDTDTWEALGGPSTMAPLTANEHGRTMLVISTPYAVHREIGKLLDAIRQGVVDPRAAYPAPSHSSPMGGMGMGGMGMGGGMGLPAGPVPAGRPSPSQGSPQPQSGGMQ